MRKTVKTIVIAWFALAFVQTGAGEDTRDARPDPAGDAMREMAAKIIRAEMERAAKEKAEAEGVAKDVAGEAAKEAAAAEVKKAAAAAAKVAAKAAAEETAKAITEAKTEVEKAEAKIKAAQDRADAREKAALERADAREKAELERADAKAKEAKEEQKAERRQIDTRIFKLCHASAEEVATNFNSMWSGEFGETWKLTKMAVAFPESNSLMITAPRVILEACEKAILELDVEAQQVYIEARFVELGNTASHKVGIDWAALDGMTGTATLGGGIQQYTVGNGVTDYTKRSDAVQYAKESFSVAGTQGGGSDGSISYFNGTLNFSQMALTLRCLDATEDAKTFSNPKIIVSSGKKATVDMTTKYPNVKISTKRTTGTSDSVDIASNLEAIPGEDKFMFAKEAFFSWGISLEVTPRISTNGLINVSIVPTISSQEDWVDTGTTSSSTDGSGTLSTRYPVIKVQRLVSEFNLASGTTAVIGGLSVTTETQRDNGIPILREIPWLGPRLFGSMIRVKEQKEIIVFVTVGLVNPREVQPDEGLPKNAVLGRQYTKGQKLEPGDRPEKNMEGFDSLDMRLLEEQAQDPLRQNPSGWTFSKFIPFEKAKNSPTAEVDEKEKQ